MRTGRPTSRVLDLERFFAKVEINANGCWIWIGGRRNTGYGRFTMRSRPVSAHVWIMELLYGPLPPGQEHDHIVCDEKLCANPAHIKRVPVAGRPNTVRHYAKRTRCGNGHELTEANVRRHGNRRKCRACEANTAQRARDRAKARR